MKEMLLQRKFFLIPVVWTIVAFVIFTYNVSVKFGGSRFYSSLSLAGMLPLPRDLFGSQKSLQDLSSEQCEFPLFSAFSENTTLDIHYIQHPDCRTNMSTVVELQGDVLRISPYLAKYNINEMLRVFCSYVSFQRYPGSDLEDYTESTAIYFKDEIRLRPGDENIKVMCYDWLNRPLFRRYMSVITENKTTQSMKREKYNKHVKIHNLESTLSVILLGIDSISRKQFERAMPDTRSFLLKSLRAIEFNKHNIVGYGTSRNLLPMLTGDENMDADEMLKDNNNNSDINYIWKVYQEAGYRTQIVLDRKNLTAFHWQKRGFLSKPSDYYSREVVIMSEKDKESRSEHCIGEVPSIVYHLDYITRMASTFTHSSTPYFSFAFLASLTHEDANMASAADEFYLNFFKSLKEKSLLHNTVIVFFSDHGARSGPFRETYSGMMEERAPFLFIVVPPWFRRVFPKLFTNLKSNRLQLTTPYDIHKTLLDILYFDGKIKENNSSKANSLLREISSSRTCESAGIDLHLCMCRRLAELSMEDNEFIKDLSMKILSKIESVTYLVRDLCQLLGLKEIRKVYIVEPEKADSETVYQLTIETFHNGGLYEGVVRVGNSISPMDAEVLDVVRINKYKEQAACITDERLMPFCYCVNETETVH